MEKKENKVAPVSKQVKDRVERRVEQEIDRLPSETDPQGMYTGKPVVPGEVPVQDADDL